MSILLWGLKTVNITIRLLQSTLIYPQWMSYGAQPGSTTTTSLYWFRFHKSRNDRTEKLSFERRNFQILNRGTFGPNSLWWTFGYDSLNLNEDVFIICVRLNLVEFNQCEIYAKCIWSQRSKDWIVDYVGSLTLIVGLCKVSRFRTHQT